MAFKDANGSTRSRTTRRRSRNTRKRSSHKPDLAIAYFYLGNSYDNLYKPARKGEPATTPT